MIIEDIKKRLPYLSESDKRKTLKYINLLLFNNDLGDDFEEDQLLLHFIEGYNIKNWERIALEILKSGIEYGPTWGYMNRQEIIEFLCKKYRISGDDADEIIRILVRKKLLKSSTHGNIC
ncbi:hypothetical protein [Pontibacter fetidus]|uniref:Uncharacterized protein n=1 Tax=Pontibacter fetidus TaxID=2700082 RepID=A0A6B2H0A0_9BACT|nr:hypothetical protein [Pontibacter fetidus]NDK56505.1 hypothetical protein [Pontibacter fetidus]